MRIEDPLLAVELARREMITALADLTSAYLRAGGDEEVVHEIHGRFFDANVDMRAALDRAARRQ